MACCGANKSRVRLAYAFRRKWDPSSTVFSDVPIGSSAALAALRSAESAVSKVPIADPGRTTGPLILPRGVWHKVHVLAPAEMVTLSPGPKLEFRAPR